ncbi:MAG: phosphoribosyltransferase [Solirubrobacterales bacterium]|nr:phosphoribosyltransferase [Solirubrobacterales bacterium]
MPSVRELSALYENVMLGPRRGPSVCVTCFNFTDGYERCYACDHGGSVLDAVVPISYSVAREQLHHALASYKRLDGDVARRLGASLAAILWRFLAEHERCLASAARTDGFDLVTTVPSGDRTRDEQHPLRWIVGELTAPTRDRYERLLKRSQDNIEPRTFSPDKFAATCKLNAAAVLLIDDTWTTGASAQSAAATLKDAGADRVAAVVIGRHLNREWHENDRRLRGIERPFDWSTCALCAEPARPRPT